MLERMISPPMVGVPCFFKWAWGPSSRTCWPNFQFMKEWDHDGAKRRTDRKGDDDRQDCLINHIAPLSLMYWVFLVYVLLKN